MVKVVRQSDKKHFTIGTDCTETLSKAKCMYNNGTATDYYMDLYGYNKCARLVTEIKKGATAIKDFCWMHVINTKGAKVEASIADMQKYFPQYI